MIKRIFSVGCILVAVLWCSAQKSQAILDYIDTYKTLAMEEMQRTGVPAAIKLAQGIHETEAGNSELVKKSNNHFGIKCKSNWAGQKVYHNDDARGECFRSYTTAEDSYRDHSNFLRRGERYAFLFKLEPSDYKGWAFGLKEAGYATNIKYSQLLIKLIEEYHLQEYTLLAIGKHQDKKEMDVETGGISAPPRFPSGVFEINRTRVTFVKAGTALIFVATQHEIPLARLLDFNDLLNDKSPEKDQLIYLQRKRKTGMNQYHVLQPGESLYDVCQLQGIRMENLLQYNMLPAGVSVASGEKIYLQGPAPEKPLLVGEKAMHVQVNQNTDTARHRLYTVQPRESLYSIAKKHNVTVAQLQEWNKLNTFEVKTGQRIVVKLN